MKTNLVRNLVATASLLAGLTGTSSALALPISVDGSLGASLNATDRYTETCPAGTTFLRVRVADLTGQLFGNAVSMQITKDSVASSTTDRTDGLLDLFQQPSASAFIAGFSGDYTVLVDKSGVGAQNYRMTVECLNAATGPTATTVPVITQNQ